MRVSIEIGGSGGGTDRKTATASAEPAVVINIDGSASAESRPSQATSAAAPLSAGAAPPGTQGGSIHAPAGEAATAAAPGLVLNAGPAPSLTDFKATTAAPHAADSYPPADVVSGGGAPPDAADLG